VQKSASSLVVPELCRAHSPSKHPIMIRNVYSCHLCFTKMCNVVERPHKNMQLGTQATMPYLRPRAAPTGCSATKKAKKRAMAVLTSLFLSPMSAVKCADSAFPIYSIQQHVREVGSQ
jgi:hypothetical protein